MNILVAAGNTQTPIDAVRCITNVFTGRTGARLATEATNRGHHVTLVTSHPEQILQPTSISVVPYRTYHDLDSCAEVLIRHKSWDAIIFAAAVSDYHLSGVYSRSENDQQVLSEQALTALDTNNKISSQHQELWLKLTPTVKIIDQIRTTWGYRGLLVKFKLEVGITAPELLEIAKRSRATSDADWIVANLFENYQTTAWIGDRNDQFISVQREQLSTVLLDQLEQKFTSDPQFASCES
ncbi:MAG: phosphopantothenoylcysteine decarboxylase [Zavarzinella sp.]